MSECNTTVRVGDVGTTFVMSITSCSAVVDVSSAIVKSIIFVKPDGTKLTRSAVFTTDGTDGKIEYATVDGDIDTPGAWRTQGYIEAPNGKWHTTIDTFTVEENL